MSFDELHGELTLPKRTIYRALEALKAAEIVVDEGGVYSWFEYRESRTYASEFDLQQALEHSKKIAGGLNFLIYGTVDLGFSQAGIEYSEPARMHLRTGYTRTFKKLKGADERRTSMLHLEGALRKELGDRLRAEDPDDLRVKYPEYIIEGIIEDAKETLRGKSSRFLADLHVENSNVVSNGRELAEKDSLDELKIFMTQEESRDENREQCENILSQEGKYREFRKQFEEDARKLILQVENGSPVLGSCQLCPKVRIMTPEKQQKTKVAVHDQKTTSG